ncbi:amidase signature enzyme [Amanita muscaria]
MLQRLNVATTTGRRFLHWRRAIAEKNASINAFVYITPKTKNEQTNAGAKNLRGLGVAIKDNICTVDAPTTCSSKMLQEFQSPFDATVVKLLREQGADILGKTNCDEFGMGSLNINSVHGPVINPLSFLDGVDGVSRSAGGSSGGSAAAVAAGMCFAALGTDTGGSVRLPASYCGVVGLKPSYGLLSRWGVVSFADSLDCVGVFAANVQDTRRVFDALNVHDPKDPTSVPEEIRRQAAADSQARMDSWSGDKRSLRGLRIGVPQEYFPAELSPFVRQRVRDVVSELKSMGATVIPVSLPSTSYALSAYYVIASAEASSNMARYDGVEYGFQVRSPPEADHSTASRVYAYTRTRGFGEEVQKRVLLGTYALTADAFDNYFLQAQKVRQLVKDDFNRSFLGVDVLIHASAIRTAPPLGEDGGLSTYVQDVLTVPASLAGVPAMSVPAGVGREGWPVGVSIVGQWGSERVLMRVGSVVTGVFTE